MASAIASDGRESFFAQLRDGDADDRRAELLEHVGDEVVRHRPGRCCALQLHQDRSRFGMADPDRQELVSLGGLQEHDWLLADEIEAHAVDLHFLHLG